MPSAENGYYCRVVFAIDLKATASSIILSYNHPSGNLRPSGEDIKMTEMIKQAWKILGIDVHDHLIISESGYFSMAEEGCM
ncbi:MAG: hypothetical protein EOO20_06830 [Chryseobacterium sp.]|nr:MAG: hypothetical protein EOO20_06830 [Chryseobacterium sp.]